MKNHMRKLGLLWCLAFCALFPALSVAQYSSALTAYRDVVLSPSGADDTLRFMLAFAKIGNSGRGARLVLTPGIYTVPHGIVESVPGLVVVGLGARVQGPGGQAGAVGVTIRATAPGVWVWRHIPPAGSVGNEYRGVHFSDFTLQGNSLTAGSLQVQTAYGVFDRLGSYGNTTGTGFAIIVPASPLDSAAENIFRDCMSQDDFTGMQIGDSTMRGSAETQVYGFINLKTTAGGIAHTGYGILVWDNNTQIHGGKLEGNEDGILVKSTPGISINMPRFEDNVWDIKLYRDAGTNGTRNVVIAPTSKIWDGPYQVNDLLIGGDWQGPIRDEGSGTRVIGNF